MSSEIYSAPSIETDSTTVNLFVGLPGCGKSTACEVAEDVIDGSTEHVEMSNYVRHAYEQEVGGETGDNELGQWAAEKKEKNGNGVFARVLASSLSNPIPAAGTINVAGVRSPAEADAFRERFDDVRIITIWTLPDIRYERLQDREDDYTVREFNERKERELWDWGCIEFFTNEEYYDHIVVNNASEQGFESAITNVVLGTPLYTNSPFPVVLTKDEVSQHL